MCRRPVAATLLGQWLPGCPGACPCALQIGSPWTSRVEWVAVAKGCTAYNELTRPPPASGSQ